MIALPLPSGGPNCCVNPNLQVTAINDRHRGTLLAIAAYLIWGFAALYWIETKPVDARDVLAHRALWSLPVTVIFLAIARRLRGTLALLGQGKIMALIALAATCISVNWGIFLWAATHGRATEASLGYFLLPLVNVMIGLGFFRESLDRAQKVGVGFAIAAISLQVINQGGLPAVSLSLALSFGLYGAIRKAIPVDSIEGLFFETLFLAPVALAWLWFRDWGGLGAHGLKVDLFLLGSGLFTAVPLIAYVAASRLMPLSALGIVFYIGPTAQLFVALALFREPMDPVQLAAFALVWIGLVFVTADSLRRTRRLARIAAGASPGGTGEAR
jgi:chloramphenicol-sensitive protein RarD